MWRHSDRSLVTDTLFIKDGPLTLRSQYSEIDTEYPKFSSVRQGCRKAIHIIGQEKSGAFFDHLSAIVRFTAPHARGEPLVYAPLTHAFVRREVYRSPDLSNPYGYRTTGEKSCM
jgi:hypothetical protein